MGYHLKSLKKYKDKYRTDSLRLEGYDYSQEGLYFITICTKNRFHYFGRIRKGMMELNASGKIVALEWIKTEQIRKRVRLGEWVVMPNHFHCIIYLHPKSCTDASHASLNDTTRNGSNPIADGFNPSLQ